MSTWECRGCTAAYSVGAPRCPQCGTDDPINEAEQLAREQNMPKITVHGGPSNAEAEPGQPGHIAPADTDEQPAGAPTGDDTDEQADTVDARELYEAQTVEDLRAELRGRELAATGNKPELVDRLLEDDDRKADQDSAE